MGSGGLEDIDGAFDVGALVEGGLFEAGADAGAGGEVDDLVEAFRGEHFIDDMGFRDIADDDGEGFGEGLEVEEVGLFDPGVVEVVEVIEGTDGVAFVEEAFAQVITDETGCAGNQDSHGREVRGKVRGMSREKRSWGRFGWWLGAGVAGVLVLLGVFYFCWRSGGVGEVERWMEVRRGQGERFTLEELGLGGRAAYASGVMDVVDAVAGAMKRFQNPAGPTESYRLDEVGRLRVVLWREPQMVSLAGFRAEWGMMELELDGVGAELERVRRAVEVIVDDPGGALYPPQLRMNPVGLRMVAQVLADAVVLELHRGRPEAALEDLVALIRLARQHGGDPSRLVQGIRLGMTELVVGRVWQAMQWEGWRVEQLELIRGELVELELVAGFVRAMEVERANGLEYADVLEATRGGGIYGDLQMRAWRAFGRADDLMFLLRSYDLFLVGARAFESTGGKWVMEEELGSGGVGWAEPELGVGARWLARAGFHYNYLVSGLVLPNFARTAELLVQAEVRRRLALTWLEVEIYRLGAGQWPADLQVLPWVDGEERWRVDPFSGEPFQYRLREGKPVLYSVGQDGVDGGGEAGDWVWPEPVGGKR